MWQCVLRRAENEMGMDLWKAGSQKTSNFGCLFVLWDRKGTLIVGKSQGNPS